MKIEPAALTGAFLITPAPHEDSRGFFARLSDSGEFGRYGMRTDFSQCSMSHNDKAGTLRGMHFQRPPHEEEKLILCVSGALWDVIVDLRPDSTTYLRWQGFELSAGNLRLLYVPRGFAHGFQTLRDDTRLIYHITTPYHPESASGCRWDDPRLAIDWPYAENRIIAEKDLRWELL